MPELAAPGQEQQTAGIAEMLARNKSGAAAPQDSASSYMHPARSDPGSVSRLVRYPNIPLTRHCPPRPDTLGKPGTATRRPNAQHPTSSATGTAAAPLTPAPTQPPSARARRPPSPLASPSSSSCSRPSVSATRAGRGRDGTAAAGRTRRRRTHARTVPTPAAAATAKTTTLCAALSPRRELQTRRYGSSCSCSRTWSSDR